MNPSGGFQFGLWRALGVGSFSIQTRGNIMTAELKTLAKRAFDFDGSPEFFDSVVRLVMNSRIGFSTSLSIKGLTAKTTIMCGQKKRPWNKCNCCWSGSSLFREDHVYRLRIMPLSLPFPMEVNYVWIKLVCCVAGSSNLRRTARIGSSPSACIARINSAVHTGKTVSRGLPRMFLTLVAAVVGAEPKPKLTYLCEGHTGSMILVLVCCLTVLHRTRGSHIWHRLLARLSLPHTRRDRWAR